jgi:methionyl-tRNA formyltransferase
MKTNFKILFIGKKDDFYSQIAADYIKTNIPETVIIFSSKMESIPVEITNWKGDYIISYLSQWIIPEEMLANAKHGGINLHPGSPSYPGIGCTNFAIYNEEKEFGITCHFMLPKVDTGGIIKVLKFPIHINDSVFSLTQRCYANIINVFFELVDNLIQGINPIASNETWQRKAYTRKELNSLCKLDVNMNKEEMDKRIKATTFGDQTWAHFDINGYPFSLKF